MSTFLNFIVIGQFIQKSAFYCQITKRNIYRMNLQLKLFEWINYFIYSLWLILNKFLIFYLFEFFKIKSQYIYIYETF